MMKQDHFCYVSALCARHVVLRSISPILLMKFPDVRKLTWDKNFLGLESIPTMQSANKNTFDSKNHTNDILLSTFQEEILNCMTKLHISSLCQ